jgi:integrase
MVTAKSIVTASGARSFYVYRKVFGRPRHIRLGSFEALSVEQARAEARIKVGEIERGTDHNAERRAVRNQTTFGQAYTDYLEKYAKAHCKPNSLAEDARIYKKHLSALATRSLAAIATGDIQTLHGDIGQAHGHYMANRVLEVVRKVINHARRNMKWKQPNPCEEIKRFPENQRERVLDEAEGKRLRKVLDEEQDSDLRDYIELLLETVQRRNNVEHMRWSQVDLVNGRWLIPGSEFKNGRPQNLSLTRRVLAILKARPRTDSDFVFPNHNFRNGWERIRKAAALVGVTRHDLRRTGGSRLAESGESEAVIAKVLGHASTRSTAVYMRIAERKADQALERISGTILGPSKRKTRKAKAG